MQGIHTIRNFEFYKSFPVLFPFLLGSWHNLKSGPNFKLERALQTVSDHVDELQSNSFLRKSLKCEVYDLVSVDTY